jgi:Ca2+-binding EF-hand superfamily protein/CRP-like cAMP-binding protein/thiol-disulfide isomerase/thioredoxin
VFYFRAFLEANPDKLIVLKVFAPWCRACKGLEPKYNALVQDDKYDNLPLVFADLTVQHNKDFVKSIGVLALPTIQFYAGSEGLVDNFPCGPSKVPILKRKLARFINERVDARTRTLKQPSGPSTRDDESETMPNDEAQLQVVESDVIVTSDAADVTTENTDAAVARRVGGVGLSEEQLQHIRNIPFFRELSEDDFSSLLTKAKVLSFEPGSIILREGMPGRMFYIIESGEVEICQKTVFADPLTTPPSYLGTVINRLTAGDYFGERALITGEPRAASIRASEKTRCFAFDVADIPDESVLSGKAGSATPQRLKQVNDKYGVALSQLSQKQVEKQILASQAASQQRGSVNSPKPIRGVDTEESDIQVFIEEDDIYPLLKRFQLIRHVSRCFDYIMKERPNWGDVPGSSNRRSMLLKRLTASQRAEFQEVFSLIDASNDGVITVLELKRVMESIGEEKSDDELLEMITSSQGGVDGKKEITMDDFMGIMAEAELYHLFRDTFAALDADNTGFVKAADLDRVLCGVRDLIADDRNSIIDVEDKDIMIDYEQFSKMLLGVTLK